MGRVVGCSFPPPAEKAPKTVHNGAGTACGKRGCAKELWAERPPRGGGATFIHKVTGVQLVDAHRV